MMRKNSGKCLFVKTSKALTKETLFEAIVDDSMTEEETKKLKSDIEAFLKAREDAFRKDD